MFPGTLIRKLSPIIFRFLYIPAPKSIFKHIRKVLPGHYVVASDNGIREVEYWDISFAHTLELTEEEWCEKLLDTLSRSGSPSPYQRCSARRISFRWRRLLIGGCLYGGSYQ